MRDFKMKYILTYDIVVPGLIEIEADDEDAAIEAVYSMSMKTS